MCPICDDCGLNQWKTVEGHIKKCAAAQPNMADRTTLELWQWRLHTLCKYGLLHPNDEKATHRGQIFQCI